MSMTSLPSRFVRALRGLAALIMICAGLHAAEAATSAPEQAVVATVAGRPILLGECEQHLLRREGAEAVAEIAKAALAKVDWAGLGSDEAILSLASGDLRRADVLKDLWPKFRDQVTEERLNIAVVRAELDRRAMVVDAAMIRGEIERAERKLADALAARGMARMGLRDYLKEMKQIELEDYIAQDGFRYLIAGLHALVRESATEELGEAELRRRFAADAAAFVDEEAVDCSIIFIPYRQDRAGTILDLERQRLGEVMATIHGQLAAGKTSFANAFVAFARSYDTDAQTDGRVGWVRRDGGRGRATARNIPPEVVAQAFAAKGPFPQLLAPIPHQLGIDIVLVHGWRPRSEPDFAAVRTRLVESIVEGDLDQRSRAMLARLRAETPMSQNADGSITVGTRQVTQREIEDAILQANGTETATRLLAGLLDRLPWQALPADRPVLAGRGWAVERGTLIAKLLERGAAQVREDLIGIAVLRAGVEAAGITVDAAMVEAEIDRLRRAYERSTEAVSRDFERFVRNAYGSSLAQLRQDAAFRALAGCAELMRRQAPPSDAEIIAFHTANRAAYRLDEAVDLGVIFIPHLPANGTILVEADKERSRRAAGQIYGLLLEPNTRFADLWERFGRRHDPVAKAGRLGWIPRSGDRGHAALKPVPAEVMVQAFATTAPYPKLLEPIEYPGGMCLVEVAGKRSASEPPLADILDRVRQDCMEVDWDARLSAFVDELRRRTEVVYEDLPPLIAARVRALTPPTDAPAVE